jgi:hypothetical protein
VIHIHYTDIRYLFQHTVRHALTAIEILTSCTPSYLIDFAKDVDKGPPQSRCPIPRLVAQIAAKCDRPTPLIVQTQSFADFAQFQIIQLWVSGQMSNFEYLSARNVHSGRTFNSSSQYPFFPWVLTSFDGEILNLNDTSIYGNLGRPIGALDDSKLADLVARRCGLEGAFFSCAPISPLAVCSYLFRLEPFTSDHIAFQGGRFVTTDFRSLPVRPISVLISPGWEFIVTYGTEVEGLMRPILVVHTINGEFVRKQPLSRPPTAFTVFSSNRGFDCFAYTIRKELHVCEVFYLGIRHSCSTARDSRAARHRSRTVHYGLDHLLPNEISPRCSVE